MSKEKKEYSYKSYIDLLSSGDIDTTQKDVEAELNSHPFLSTSMRPHAIQVSLKKGDSPTVEVHQGKKSPERDSAEINHNTSGYIASMTKVFTAATLLKLWDNELTEHKKFQDNHLNEENPPKQNFPDGMKTKLSSFMPSLKEKFPDNSYLPKIEEAKDYDKVTLKDLLNHTHGLGEKNPAKFREEQIRHPDKQFSCSDVLEYTEYNSKQHVYGRFKYGNLGTDLSGMIIELISGKSYDQALRDEILDPIGTKNTYTLSDKLEEGVDIATGYAFTSKAYLKYKTGDDIEKDGVINHNTSSNARGAASLKSCPDDGHLFLRKYLSKDPDVSMFENQEIRDVLWDRRPVLTITGEERDYQFCVADCGDNYFGHDGVGTSFDTIFLYNPEKDTSFYYATAGETLTNHVAFDIASQVYPEKTEQKKLSVMKDIMPIQQDLINKYSFEDLLHKKEVITKSEIELRQKKELGKELIESGVSIESSKKDIKDFKSSSIENLEQKKNIDKTII